MKVLITGGSGQLGQELAPLFAANPRNEVVALASADCDLAERDAVLGAVCGLAPDLIVHAGAMTAVDRCETEPDLAYAVNALGARHVADGARRVGAHVVYVSTDYVFDGSKPTPYTEWDDPNPQSVYGRSKLGGEREIDPGWAVVRTSWVSGAHGANIVKTILRLADAGAPLAFVTDQRGSPTMAADLAAMVHRLAVDRRPGLYHVTNQGVVSWWEYARAVVAAGGHAPDRVGAITTAELDPPRPAPRPANSALDNAALRLCGLETLPHFEESLTRLVRRLRA
ncbi:MAG: dTDP-4-dehydrorhamnose reductase [Acidimicrobiales bacterium]